MLTELLHGRRDRYAGGLKDTPRRAGQRAAQLKLLALVLHLHLLHALQVANHICPFELVPTLLQARL